MIQKANLPAKFGSQNNIKCIYLQRISYLNSNLRVDDLILFLS